MSHNYPYRRPPSDSDPRPDPGPYSPSDRRLTSSDQDFYRAPQESFSSSSSSSRGAQWSQDGALSILSSCGLEPSDLALLAELPEDVLTVESLPHLLTQIKGKRGTVKPFPPSAPSPSSSSYAPSSTRRPAVSPSTGDWDHLRSQPLQYPMDRVTPSPLLSDLDRWGNPRTSSSVRADPPSSSSSSSRYMVDFHHRSGPPEYGKTGTDAAPVSSQDYNHRPGPSDYGKTGRDAGLVSSQDRPSFSLAGRGKRNHPSRFSHPAPADHRSAPPPEECHPKTRGGHRESKTSSIRSSSRPATLMPSKKEARDFHGTSPQVFPYSCSLCDITVMSERVWIKHINGTQHADGQLSLLQQFPNWDCRMETVNRAISQSETWKDEGKPDQASNQDSKPQPNKKTQKKTSEKSKVVCVKFPAQSVDEMYLRKLTEPFGRIVKILMFPSLAFVELGSIDQAKDLVKFHVNCPPTVNGEQMEFRISNTFNFLQSSRVVSFTPVPTGEEGRSDLFSIIKRFGAPLYTLFLPSKAFVEMKNPPDAQKLVDYYSSNTLRINNDFINVSFSGEYKSLMRVASAKRYEEETCLSKRTRSPSREKEDKTTERRRRSSKDREEEEVKTRTRSRSREKSTKEKMAETRSWSREKSSKEKTAGTRSRSREKSTKEKTTGTRSGSREKSIKEKTAGTRSRSREKSTKEKTTGTRSQSREKSSKEKTPRTRSRSRDNPSRDRRTRTRSKSGEKSTKEKRTRTRSMSKEKSREKSSREKRSRSRDKSSRDGSTKTRSKSQEKSSRERRSRSRSRSKEKSVAPEKTADTESSTDPGPAPVRDSRPEAEETEQNEQEAESSAEESDIEGMEVIGEDGENLEDEDMETLDDADGEEEEEEEAAEKDNCPAERTDSPEEDKEEEKTWEEADDQEQREEKVMKKVEKTIKNKEEEQGKPMEEEEEEMCGIKKQEEESESNREAEETAETPLEEDEEEPDFPEDLENCITLDELEEDQSDDQDEEVRDEPKSPSTRVVCFRNVPQRFYTDAEFINLVRDFGTAVRYLRAYRQQKGFIEMSTSSEAQRVVKELTRNPVNFITGTLAVQISNKYKRLANGWVVQSGKDSDEEKGSESKSRSSRRNERQSKSKTSDRDETCRKSEGRKESSKKTLEKLSTSKKTPEKESVSKTAKKSSSEKESMSRHSPEKSSEKKTPEKGQKSQEKDATNVSEKTPEKESKQTEEKEDSAQEESAAKKTPEKESLPKTNQENKMLKRKGTHENDSVPEKKDKKKEATSDETQRKQELEPAGAPEEEIHEKKGPEEKTFEPGLKDSESPDQPDSTGDPPKPQTEQRPAAAAAADRLQDSEVQVEPQSGPAGGAEGLERPTKPVGTEFVRPVVGYFCSLCQLIYADEDEAKLQHCSSPAHYSKYQEQTGRDPWAS